MTIEERLARLETLARSIHKATKSTLRWTYTDIAWEEVRRELEAFREDK